MNNFVKGGLYPGGGGVTTWNTHDRLYYFWGTLPYILDQMTTARTHARTHARTGGCHTFSTNLGGSSRFWSIYSPKMVPLLFTCHVMSCHVTSGVQVRSVQSSSPEKGDKGWGGSTTNKFKKPSYPPVRFFLLPLSPSPPRGVFFFILFPIKFGGEG